MHANWIAQSRTITVDEAIRGGTYYFSRNFNLTGATIQKASIEFLVDDYLRIQINNLEVGEEYGGFDKVHELDITEFLAAGNNQITFEVRNRKKGVNQKIVNGEENPYEFIYAIEILIEDPTF